jgi:hypothetical protein
MKRSLLATRVRQTVTLTQLRHFSSAQAAYSSSFVDTSQLTYRQNGETLRREPDRTQFKHSAEIPDFDVQSRLRHEVAVTPEMAKRRHPLEYVTEHMRKHENPFNRMNENSLMLTNFPSQMVLSTSKVEGLVKQADKNAVVKSVHIQQAMRGDQAGTSGQRAAYATVEFSSGHNVASVRRGLRKHWIDDCLLKVKTLKDMKTEAFDDRTIVVNGVAAHADLVDLVNQFGRFGAITHIELPSVDSVVKA